MRQIWCPGCGSFESLIEEPMHKDDLNPYPWGDLLCATCRLVIASVREIPDVRSERKADEVSANA